MAGDIAEGAKGVALFLPLQLRLLLSWYGYFVAA
eukprot:UN00566